MKGKGVKTKLIENISDITLILWIEDSEGNYFAFEQWKKRG
jgi:hypothetical protein